MVQTNYRYEVQIPYVPPRYIVTRFDCMHILGEKYLHHFGGGESLPGCALVSELPLSERESQPARVRTDMQAQEIVFIFMALYQSLGHR